MRARTLAFALSFTTAVVLAGSVVASSEYPLRIAGLSVTMWSRNPESPLAHPVIIFSHGLRGCATQSRFLMEAFAASGYLVFAPNHRDAACGEGGGRGGQTAAPLAKPETWTSATYRYRADDIAKLLNALRGDARYRQLADWNRVALAGHSLGGYTVHGLGGAWPEWKLQGVKAILALSPYTQPFEIKHTLGGVSAPVMYQGGTRDLGITPTVRKWQGSYDQSPAPKYFVEFDKAGHFAWTNLSTTAHADIAAYSVAFMDRYVNGGAANPVLTTPRTDVTVLRYESELGSR